MTSDQRAGRLAAARWFAQGQSRAWVARRAGVSRATASRWFRIWLEGGVAALASRRPAGRRPRLTRTQEDAVRRLFLRPPHDAGFDLDRWSLAAAALAIEQRTGVRFHRRHIGRLLRRLGWSVTPVGAHARAAFLRVPIDGPGGVPHALRVRASS